MQTDQPDVENYRKAVEFIESFSNSSIRKYVKPDGDQPAKPNHGLNFYIDRTKYFLEMLGNPEKGFKYIHITGTAGKGSVSAMLHEMLVQSGKRTGIFTSPYVTTTAEQIKVDELFIAPQEFADIVVSLKPQIEIAKGSAFGIPSAFELLFIISILYFKQQNCEWVVLEVGMGGRYDATNVIENPVVTAITNIGLDHTDILGKTVEEIAHDKMGIIKPQSAFFTSEQRPELLKMFEDCCKSLGATYSAISEQKSYSAYNTELVRAIGKHLGIDQKFVERGIVSMQLPCRFEIMQTHPCIILDGAHNKPKTASTIANLSKLDFDKLFLIVTVSDTKDEKTDIIKPLMSTDHETHAFICQITASERKSVSPNFLLPIAQQYMKDGSSVEIIENPHQALAAAISRAGKDDIILVTGSFFLAGELRKRWIPEEWVLRNRRSFR